MLRVRACRLAEVHSLYRCFSCNASRSEKDMFSNIHVDDEKPPQSKSKRDNTLRYLVLSNRADRALDILEKSINQTPIIIPSIGHSRVEKARYLKLPPASVVNKVLKLATYRCNPSAALKSADIARQLMLENIQLYDETLILLTRAIAGSSKPEQAMHFFDEYLRIVTHKLEDDDFVKSTPFQLISTILRAAVRTEDIDLAMLSLARHASLGLIPHPLALGGLISLVCRWGRPETSFLILNWMKTNKIMRSTVLYSKFLHCPKDPAEAVKVLTTVVPKVMDEMNLDSMKPDNVYFRSLMELSSISKDSVWTEKAWKAAKDAGIQLNCIASETLRACAACNDVATALDVCTQVTGIPDSNHLSGGLFEALKSSPENLDLIYDKLRSKNLKSSESV